VEVVVASISEECTASNVIPDRGTVVLWNIVNKTLKSRILTFRIVEHILIKSSIWGLH
jgi:hypothetical protein